MRDFEIIYETRGKAKEYAPLGVELYTGCSYGCKYCFVPKTLNISVEEFHKNYGPVKDALNKLKRDAELLKAKQDDQEILLCFHSDPYQRFTEEYKNITGQAIEILVANDLRFAILTKSGLLGTNHFDLLRDYEKFSFGTTLIFTNQDDADKWEPNADKITSRLEAIKMARNKRIKTWVSLEPVIDPKQALELIEKYHSIVDHWKIGKINYHPEIEAKVDWIRFREEVKSLLDTLGADYYLKKSLTEFPWTEGEIPRREGKCNILVIAPHGHKEDDANTGKIARQIADKLNCYAVINEKYQKPESAGLDKPDISKGIADLYDWKHLNEFPELKEGFLDPVEAFKRKILAKYQMLYIIHTHGIDDENIPRVAKITEKYKNEPDNLQVLVGYGQRANDNSRHTANLENFVQPFIKEIEGDDLKIDIAPTEVIIGTDGKEKLYCGNDPNRLNQRLCEPKDRVQSIQLEIKKKNARENQDQSFKTADCLCTALSKVVSDTLLVPAKIKTEDDLVSDAFKYLKGIFQRHFHEAMLEAGRYLIKTFYKKNPEIAFAKNKTKEQPQSLKKLIEKIQQTSNNPSENVPSTSWLYNAVNLAAHEMICKQEGFQTFGILGHSHKLQLLHVPKLKKIDKDKFNEAIRPAFQEKERLATVAIEKKLSVRDFKAYIKAQHPDDSGTIDLTKLPPLDELRQRESKELSRLRNLAKRKIDECQKKIDEYQKMRGSYNEAFHTLSDVLTEKEAAQTGEMLLPKTVKVITDDGLEKEAIATIITSKSRVNNRNRWDITSALQKSIRWCEVNESRYFARELMDMGIPGAVFNRLIIIPAEDVGLADPSLIVYERQCSDHFEKWIKQNKIKKSEAVKFPELCEIVDRAVIAAAISYKSRLLPQLSFATLFDIYQKEDFSKNLSEYLRRFVGALKKGDEKQATYYAYVVDILFDSKDQILTIIQGLSGMRNKDLIQKWVEEYKRESERLMLAGSIVLLCRDLKYPHGEYNDAVYQYLSVPIKKAEIPDRAYDMHTSAGPRRGRGFEHFFDEAATVKNERFLNDCEEAGRTAYTCANQEGLGKAVKIIEAIKEKHEKYKKSHKREAVYNSASV